MLRGMTLDGMTVYLAVACLLGLAALHRFSQSGLCTRCGGRGAHRADCPLGKP